MDLEEFKKNVDAGIIKDKWYFYKRTDKCKSNLIQDMYSLSTFMKETLDLDIYLIYGTLLGAIRENNFIEHDNDVDFSYLSKQTNEIDVLNEFNNICSILKNYELLSKVCCKGQLHVYSSNKRNKFDLWTSYIKNDKYCLIPLFTSELNSSIILPFKTHNLRGGDFLIPNQSELLLDTIYHNWKTPILEPKEGMKKQWKKIL